jgi:hypothetical protein
MWHHFGDYAEERAHDLVHMYKNYFSNDTQPSNLAKLTEQFIWRTAVNIERENNITERGDSKTLKASFFSFNSSRTSFGYVHFQNKVLFSD